jgi:electron transfer flavoprotein alpha subunit
MNENKDILVILEGEDGAISRHSASLLVEGSRLTREAGGNLHAVFIGPSAQSVPKDAGAYGAKTLYRAEGKTAVYDPATYRRIFDKLLSELQPGLVLALTSSTCSDVLPRLAYRFQAPLVTNCADIEITADGTLKFLRPVQNGRLFAHVRCPDNGLKLATVLPECLADAEVQSERMADVISLVLAGVSNASPIRVTGFVPADHRSIDISEAQVIVAVGRGLGGKEQLASAEALADRLGAAIGGTRPMVDMRVLPYERQIGQTGKRVSPKLIFLCGISGAVEFTQGIKGGGKRIAINVDRNAPALKSADLGIVGDCRVLLPQLLTSIDNLAGKAAPKPAAPAARSAGGNIS